jgi:hypothetical protein
MRFLLIGIICLFCGAAFAEETTVTNENTAGADTTVVTQKVPNSTYVDLMANSVPINRPEVNAPAGRALVWIEE